MPRADIGVIESDEAAFPEIVRRVQPSIVLLNNLFRDQLDRYGELDAIATKWRPPAAAPGGIDGRRERRRSDAGRDHGRTFWRAASPLASTTVTRSLLLDALPHAADAKVCRTCGADLTYDRLYSAHLGAWRCPWLPARAASS